MAIYVPAGVRRRRLIAIAVAMLVAGLALGFWVGRATSPGVDDAVADVRSQAAEAATALKRLPIEYEQAVSGKGGESTRTITDALARARTELDGAFDSAEWFGPAADDAANEAIQKVERAVKEKAPQAEFEEAVADAVATIESTFGLDSEAGPTSRPAG